MVTSDFFGYNETYSISDTVFPGKGYWVKSQQNGKLILSSFTSNNNISPIKIVSCSDLPPQPPSLLIPSNNNLIIVDFRLEQNYPNPFNPVTDIRYLILNIAQVTLKIYDLVGREIATLVNDVKQPGEYSVEWNAEGLPSGIYFCKISAGTFVDTKKMLLVR
jgi:hypothetical protein